jgi:choline-sulfatase
MGFLASRSCLAVDPEADMSDVRPNVLLVMTDQERYPPPDEDDGLGAFRRSLAGHDELRSRGIELHHHYAVSTACVPSRASLFTGQYPSLHGVTNTDGMARSAQDPAISWLDPDVPGAVPLGLAADAVPAAN